VGCKAFTPHLVSLAKELNGAPFHLIASHNQNGSDEAAKHEIFQNGFDPLSANTTVARHARHPGVRGTGYVPYYLVFDEHGDLAYHHQGGPYHGGDGQAVLKRVRQMVKELPAVYLGKEPFERHARLAAELRSGKKLHKSLLALAKAKSEHPDDAEINRLIAGVERHQSRSLAEANRLSATDPSAAIMRLKTAAKIFAGTPWSSPLDDRLAQLEEPATMRSYKAAAKSLRAAIARIEQLDRVRGNGGQVLNLLDATFRSNNQMALSRIKEALSEVSSEHTRLPAGKLAGELVALL